MTDCEIAPDDNLNRSEGPHTQHRRRLRQRL